MKRLDAKLLAGKIAIVMMMALIAAGSVLAKLKADGEEQFGIDIVREALTIPLKQIAVNAGEEGGKTLKEVTGNKDYNYGFNALTGKFGDMIQMGVVDPKKVTRTSLQNAASVASVLLTTDVLVAKIPEKKPDMPPGGPGGDPYGGGMGGMGGMY